jgi:hypothetical protein
MSGSLTGVSGLLDRLHPFNLGDITVHCLRSIPLAIQETLHLINGITLVTEDHTAFRLFNQQQSVQLGDLFVFIYPIVYLLRGIHGLGRRFNLNGYRIFHIIPADFTDFGGDGG